MFHEIKDYFQIDKNVSKGDVCDDICVQSTTKWKFSNHIIHHSKKSDHSNLIKNESRFPVEVKKHEDDKLSWITHFKSHYMEIAVWQLIKH